MSWRRRCAVRTAPHWHRHRLMAAAIAQHALHSIVTTIPAFLQGAPYHVHVPLSMRPMPLIGIGTAVAIALGGAWAPAAYRADGCQRLWP
jgi:hypothetical protein